MQTELFIKVFETITSDDDKTNALEKFLPECKSLNGKEVVSLLKLYKDDKLRFKGFEQLLDYKFSIGEEFMNIVNTFDKESGFFIFVVVTLTKLCDFESENGLVNILNSVKYDKMGITNMLMIANTTKISFLCFYMAVKHFKEEKKENNILNVIQLFAPHLENFKSFDPLMKLLELFAYDPDVQQDICYYLFSRRFFEFEVAINIAEKLSNVITDISCYRKVCKLFDIASNTIEKYKPAAKS